jgi:hypothetical protein
MRYIVILMSFTAIFPSIGYGYNNSPYFHGSMKIRFVPKFDHITPTLMRLHWLPVKYRVIFKIVLLVYKALHGLAPKYIRDMLTYKQSNNYSLRSDELGLLHVPNTRRKSFGDRAFLKAGPTLWNLVPCEIRLSPSLDS